MRIDPLEHETIALSVALARRRVYGHEIGVIDIAGAIGLDMLHRIRCAKLLRNRIQLFHSGYPFYCSCLSAFRSNSLRQNGRHGSSL